jgi:hypothetical protein
MAFWRTAVLAKHAIQLKRFETVRNLVNLPTI